MDPDAHRRDCEQLLAERETVAARGRAEVDAVVEAAAEKRRAFLEWFENHVRIEAKGELERERVWADMRLESVRRRTDAAEAVVPEAPPQADVLWQEPESESDQVPMAAVG